MLEIQTEEVCYKINIKLITKYIFIVKLVEDIYSLFDSIKIKFV